MLLERDVRGRDGRPGADGKEVRCEVKLPLPPCEQLQNPCNDPSVTLELSGCALDTSAHSITGLRINGKPSKVIVSMNRDNLQLFLGHGLRYEELCTLRDAIVAGMRRKLVG
ncbi:MAG: hypothetical protein RMJ98_18340 [Myxococcales bacterium]|nr:hypothetical protein [Polyangiaceae bacterium]MDW8251258.1 hypothetical protein [Myxococcales bacterium]